MRKGEGVGQGGPRQERAQAPRIPIHMDGVSLGLKRTELTECPPADDRNLTSAEPVDPSQPLWERAVRALKAMRDIRVWGNGMPKQDRNTAPSESVDEERRAPRKIVKLRSHNRDSSFMETTLTGSRARLEVQKKLPIPDVEEETVRPEDLTLSIPEGIDIYVARGKKKPADPVRLERRGILPPSADQLSDDPTAEEREQELEEASEYAGTAVDLRS